MEVDLHWVGHVGCYSDLAVHYKTAYEDHIQGYNEMMIVRIASSL